MNQFYKFTITFVSIFAFFCVNGLIDYKAIYATLDPLGDEDQDGLLNKWESEGYDINNDGNIDLYLSTNPEHKDIFVEVDYMENHRPYAAAIDVVKRAFSHAPISNPDGYNGINLHVVVDEQIPESLGIPKAELISIKNNHLGSPYERGSPENENIIAAKQKIFHYALFAHTLNERPIASGWTPSTPGMEFIVTLGYPGWGEDPGSHHTVGSVDQQAGTFMHELGHTLGLHHGGSDSILNKVNYLSVMNYNFQFADNVPDRPYDFSRLPQKSVDENNLFEPFGIGMTSPIGLVTYINCPIAHEATTFDYITGSAVDFNGDGDVTDGQVPGSSAKPLPLDLNCDGNLTNLIGQNDWVKLRYLSSTPFNILLSPSLTVSNISIPERNLSYNISINDPSDERSIIDVKKDRISKFIGIINGLSRLPIIEPIFNLTNVNMANGTILTSYELISLNNTLIPMLNSSSISDLDFAIGNLTAFRSELQTSIIDSPTTTNRSLTSDLIFRLDNLIGGLEMQR